ncbi:MAG: HAD family hydrolase [Actinomycetota bacterium]|nr:HAD family hydrolase [Actinomycetota bacterium]
MAVTFDFWNTLIREDSQARDRRVDAWLGLLEGEGVALEREHVGDAFTASWKTFQQHWMDNRVYGAPDAVSDILGHLGLDPPSDVHDALVDVLTDPSREHDPLPTDNIDACLEQLSRAGVRLGIICDVGLTPSRTLRRYLDGHGLLRYFDHWSFSDDVGTYKPDPAIFRHAHVGLGVDDPTRSAHVGDLRRTDIAGAQSLGIVAVRYAGVFDDPGSSTDGSDQVEGDHVVADHADLPAALGLS